MRRRRNASTTSRRDLVPLQKASPLSFDPPPFRLIAGESQPVATEPYASPQALSTEKRGFLWVEWRWPRASKSRKMIHARDLIDERSAKLDTTEMTTYLIGSNQGNIKAPAVFSVAQ